MQNKEPLILVFDCGTQSTRAFLFNKNGDIIDMTKQKQVPYYSTRLGFAEKKTEDYWQSICDTSKELKEKAGKLWDNIIAVTVTMVRSTYTSLDKDGNPLRPTITWLDQRMAKCKKKFPFVKGLMFRFAGITDMVTKQRKVSPSSWLKENEPEIWAKTDKFVMISAYVNFRMCGKIIDGVANQAGRLPYDYKHHKWHKPNSLHDVVFNCDLDKMCDLMEPGEIMGYVTKKASEETGIKEGLTIIVSGSDKACETLGVGCLKQDSASISFGTTATVQIMTPKYVEPQSFMPAYNSVYGWHFNPEIQVFRGYWMVTWFKEQFAESEEKNALLSNLTAETILDKELLKVPPGSEGLILQPYWAPGIKQPEAKGSVIGFNDCHKKYHFYRAIIEGINYALLEGLQSIEKRSKRKVEKIFVSGGGSQSDVICQITADIFGLPVIRAHTFETSGLGAAIVGFVGMKEFNNIDEASSKMTRHIAEFYPNAKNHALYQELYNKVYIKMYKKLKKLYKNIYSIINLPAQNINNS